MRIDKFCILNFKNKLKKINLNRKIMSAKQNKLNIEISEKYLNISSSKLEIIIDNLKKCQKTTEQILYQFKGLTTITPLCKDYCFFETICLEIYIQVKNLHNSFNYIKSIIESYASEEHLLFNLNIIYKNTLSGNENDLNNTIRKDIVKITSPLKMYQIPNISVKIKVKNGGVVNKDNITFEIYTGNQTEEKTMNNGINTIQINDNLILEFTINKFLSKNDIILVSTRNKATLGICTKKYNIRYLNYIIDRLDIYNCLNSILDDGSELCYPNINTYKYVDYITIFIYKYYNQLFNKNIKHLIEINNPEYWSYLNTSNILDVEIPNNFDDFVSDFETVYGKLNLLINIFMKLINIFEEKLIKFQTIYKDIQNNKVFDSEVFKNLYKFKDSFCYNLKESGYYNNTRKKKCKNVPNNIINCNYGGANCTNSKYRGSDCHQFNNSNNCDNIKYNKCIVCCSFFKSNNSITSKCIICRD
jgi:hypothetical protein